MKIEKRNKLTISTWPNERTIIRSNDFFPRDSFPPIQLTMYNVSCTRDMSTTEQTPSQPFPFFKTPGKDPFLVPTRAWELLPRSQDKGRNWKYQLHRKL